MGTILTGSSRHRSGATLVPALAAIVTFFVVGLMQWIWSTYRPALAVAITAGTLAIGVWSLWFLHDLYTPRVLTLADVLMNARWTTVDFGGQMALVGYVPPSPIAVLEDRLHFTFYWQAERIMHEDYRVSVRLLDKAGKMVWEWKRSPGAGRLPADRWPPGAVIAEVYSQPLDSYLPPGCYTLQVGVHRFLTDQWLLVGKVGQNGNLS